MICYFDKTETAFDHNGKGVLDNNIVSPVVHEELNGSFYFEFEYPMQAKYAKELVPEIIIRCPVSNLPDQLFRITERNESLGGVMQIVAHHIFYDLAKNLIEDTYLVNRTGSQALQQLLSNTQFSHQFQGTSDILTANNARLVRLNPVEVLLDADLDNGFQARWGGEIERDNFSISMLSQRGSDNGVQIRDKKNLTGYQSNIDTSSIVTRIMPQGYDGLFLPEKYVDSPLINQYISPKIKVVRYDGVKVGEEEDDYKTEQEAFIALRRLANEEFSKHQIDKPLITYEVEFAPLQQTKEYANFISLETINLGDTVSVIHEEDGLNISARMISYTYDPLRKVYKKITLGNILPKFTDIGKAIHRVDSKVEQVQTEANFALTSANGKNTNYYGTQTPKNPKAGDLWFKENGEKTEIWLYETREGNTQWFALSNDLTAEQIKLELADAQEKVDEAIEKSEEAKLAGEEALSAGQEAFEMGNQAKEKANQAILDSSQAVNKANDAFNQAVTAQTGVGNLTTRVISAETTIINQGNQIASKASQTSVDTLTGRMISAETSIIQNAESFQVLINKQSKVVNEMLGVNILQSDWSVGALSTSTGIETSSTSYVRSGWFDVKGGEKYLIQTKEGTNAQTLYGTMQIYYYKEDKTFISSTSVGASTVPFTVPAQATFARIRLTTTDAVDAINCYLIQTDKVSGWIPFDTMSSFFKLQATSDNLLVSLGETQQALGTPFMVRNWERGTLNSSTGAETASNVSLRSEFIDVSGGDKFVSQGLNGESLSVTYHYFRYKDDYVDYVPNAKQLGETLTSGSYTNTTIVQYLNSKNVSSLAVTGSVSTNPYTNGGDYLIIYKLSLDGKSAPQTITWNGRKDSSDNIVFLYSNGKWEQIGSVTNTSLEIHEWILTESQRAGIQEELYLAFFSIKTGSYAGIYNGTTTPYLLNPENINSYQQISTLTASAPITVPATAIKMRVRVATSILPNEFTGNIYKASERQDYSKSTSIYSALLMQNGLINLRVAKDDVINQINISTEEILIAGNKIRITGQTTIDNTVIQTAHIANLAVTEAKIASLAVTTAKIADAAITNAKIANLDAGKINTGTLSANRIAAGSITSSKLTIADGFITNAMIANATIQSAKIAAIDAAKITTGTLNAARIASNSITADKVATNFLTTLTGSSSIRITGTTIGYYSGSNLVTAIDSQGMKISRDGVSIGKIGANNVVNQPTWRGLVFDLEYSANYMSWSNAQSSSSSTYTIKLAWYRSKLQNGMEKGFHFSDPVYFKDSIGASNSAGTTALCNVLVMTLDNLAYLAFRTTTGKAGIAMNGSKLVLGDSGQWVEFSVIREICKKLAGRSIALPTGFNSDGTAKGWYNPQSFNTMTWWTT